MKKCIFFLLFSLSLFSDVFTTISRIEELIGKKERGAYFCFADEDIHILQGKSHDIWAQFEMEQLIALDGPNILKAYDLSYSVSKRYKHTETPYPPLAPAFLSTLHQETGKKFFQFLRSQKLYLVSDVEIPKETMSFLFGPSCQFLKAEEIDRVPFSEYSVLILATCPDGKLLAPKLLRNEPIFFIDLSDLKVALSKWETPVWSDWHEEKKPAIRILYTSVLLPFKFEERKLEYIKSLEILKDFGYQAYIVEAGPYTPLSFFENHSSHVFYANTNDISYLNKGVNEANALLAALDYYDFDDEDMIVKLTGRYFFNHDGFFKKVEENPDIDAFASLHPTPGRGVTTGCFAMRCKYFKQMLKELDLEKMEKELIDIEKEVFRYLQKLPKVLYLDKIGITANVSNTQIVQW